MVGVASLGRKTGRARRTRANNWRARFVTRTSGRGFAARRESKACARVVL